MGRRYTVLKYLYRDACNYKVYGNVLLSGTATKAEESFIWSCVGVDGLFVAEQVGLPTLYAQLWNLSGGQIDDDHAYHELHSLRAASNEDIASIEVWGSMRDFISRLKSTRGRWDWRLSLNCAGR